MGVGPLGIREATITKTIGIPREHPSHSRYFCEVYAETDDLHIVRLPLAETAGLS